MQGQGKEWAPLCWVLTGPPFLEDHHTFLSDRSDRKVRIHALGIGFGVYGTRRSTYSCVNAFLVFSLLSDAA